MSLLGKKRDEQTVWDEEPRNEEEPEKQVQNLPPPPLVAVGPRKDHTDQDRPSERCAPEDQER